MTTCGRARPAVADAAKSARRSRRSPGRRLTLSKPLAFARASIRRPDGSIVVDAARREPRTTDGHPEREPERACGGTRRTSDSARRGTSKAWRSSAWGGHATKRLEQHDRRPLAHRHEPDRPLRVPRPPRRIVADRPAHQQQRVSRARRRQVGAVAVHQSHDTEVIGNVCVDTPGGCFVTEDGNEVRNVFRGNFAAFVTGNGVGVRPERRQGLPRLRVGVLVPWREQRHRGQRGLEQSDRDSTCSISRIKPRASRFRPRRAAPTTTVRRILGCSCPCR